MVETDGLGIPPAGVLMPDDNNSVVDPPKNPEDAAPSISPRAQQILSSPIGALVQQVAQKEGFDPAKAAAFISIESSGNPNASTGSYHGLGQLSGAEFAKYGDGGNIFDPTANLTASIRSWKEKSANFHADFGRDPTDTELYLLHQQGEGGLRAHVEHPDWPAWQSMLSTGEGRQKGAAWAQKAIWGNVPNDMKAQYGDVNNITSADFIKMWDAKLHGGKPSGQINFGAPITPQDLQPPPPPPSEATELQTAFQMAHREKQTGWVQSTQDAFHDTLTGRILDATKTPDFAPDPNFNIQESDLQTARQAGLSDVYIPRLAGAVSKPNFDFIVKSSLDEQSREQALTDAGWTGTAARVGTMLLDPVAITAGVASGGLADLAVAGAGAGTAVRIGAQAAAGAASNLGIDQALGAMGDPSAGDHLLRTAALGALFGAGYGVISRNPYLADEAFQMQKVASSLEAATRPGSTLKSEYMGSTALKGSVGAMTNPNADIPILTDKDWLSYSGAEVPYAAGGAVRFSATGQLKSSSSPVGRSLGALGLDMVGGSKGDMMVLNPIAVSEATQRDINVSWGDWQRSYKPALKEWADSQNLGTLGRLKAGSQFGTEVSRYVRNEDATVEFHPAVARAGEKARKILNQVREDANEPLGPGSRPVQGFGETSENPNYMFRSYVGRKINEAMDPNTGYGMKGVKEWFKGAIREKQPWIDEDFLDKMSEGTARNLYKKANGIDERFNLAMSGDTDALKEFLSENTNISEDEINKFTDKLNADRNPDSGAVPRGKHRILLDENYKLPYPKGDGTQGTLSLEDLTETDAHVLMHQYLRQMHGRINLARFRVKNPDTGNLLIDGITSDRDFNGVISKMKKWNGERKIEPEQTKKDVANATWLYNRILGRADEAQSGKIAANLTRLRKFNFIRLMGQAGYSQINDYAKVVASIGIKAALQHMPAFRRIVNMDGELALRHGLSHEIEANIGVSPDPLRGLQNFREDDHVGALSGPVNKLDNALNFGSDVMSYVGGLAPIHGGLQRMAAKGVVQKFADLAKRPNAANMKRMASLGLDDPMLKRILAQTKHFDKEPGLIFNDKVTRMNLDKWTDPEARAAFENAVFRWTRRMVHEADYGAMHRWSSKPLWQMFSQFRTFTLMAWENHFLHNLYMRDMQSVNMALMSTVMGAAAYAVRTNINSIGRSDRREYLKKALAPDRLAEAGFQLAGWSSILPMVMDTGMRLGGLNPIFDFRSTGQSTDALLGNPTMDLINSFGDAMKGTVNSIKQHRQMSQKEFRNWERITPMATFQPFMPIFNSLISKRPAYAPGDK